MDDLRSILEAGFEQLLYFNYRILDNVIIILYLVCSLFFSSRKKMERVKESGGMYFVNRVRNRSYKGSYTVEAAMLMGIIITVMASLLIMCFYLHDRAVLQAMTCEIASAGNNFATEQEQQKITAELKKILTKDRLMGSRNVSQKIDADNKKVYAGWQAEYPVPGLAAKFIIQNKLGIHASWEAEKVQAADTIRKIRGIRKLVNGGVN